jgi:hypothetical protein
LYRKEIPSQAILKRHFFQTGLTDIEKSEILSRFDAALQNLGREPERKEEVVECFISDGKILEAKRLNRNPSLVSHTARKVSGYGTFLYANLSCNCSVRRLTACVAHYLKAVLWFGIVLMLIRIKNGIKAMPTYMFYACWKVYNVFFLIRGHCV